jgi:hypothetical protein
VLRFFIKPVFFYHLLGGRSQLRIISATKCGQNVTLFGLRIVSAGKLTPNVTFFIKPVAPSNKRLQLIANHFNRQLRIKKTLLANRRLKFIRHSRLFSFSKRTGQTVKHFGKSYTAY